MYLSLGKAAKEAGSEVTYWQQSPEGRWEPMVDAVEKKLQFGFVKFTQ